MQQPPSTRGARRRARRRRTRRRLGVACGVAVVVVLVLVAVVPTGAPVRGGGRRVHDAAVPTGRVARNAAHDRSGAAGHSSAGPATFLGPYGVESKAIIAENREPGTTAWRITDAPPTGMIEGFADRNYVADGQSFGLYVSTTAPSFHVVAYRMGYYQGKGGRQVWVSGSLPGRVQPACPLDHATNMVSCDNWSRSTTVEVTSSWSPGDYVLKLVGSGNQQAYVLLTVWDPNSHAAYMVVNRTLTEEGWNTFGGYDFYQGEGPCILDHDTYPPCNRARVVSLDRPFAQGDGAEDFFGNEYPLIYWMEEHGLDVTYVTDITLSQHPGIALHHRVWLSLDHDETWTWTELQAARAAMAHGVNILFFSGAAIVRHARLQASPLGADREVVDYRNPQEDPESKGGNPNLVTTNQWPPIDSSLTGQEYAGFMLPGEPEAAMVVYDASSWVFDGTGLRNGSRIPDVIGSDIDHLDPSSGLTPADLQVLAHSPIPLSEAYTNQGEWSGYTYSDFTYYTDPASGAGVIDTGDTVFIGDLRSCNLGISGCQPVLLRIVGNLLRVFGQGPAGHLEPPRPNWRSVQPSGS